MNKIMNINLGGLPLTIDEDAFNYLQNYTNGLQRVFAASEGREEIIADIEARLGELISQKLGGRPIVSIREVEAAVAVLGRPEQLDNDPTNDDQPYTTDSQSGSYGKNYTTGRRLFRDEQDAVVAGVCSGIAQYFGVSDPLWVRLGFVLMSFTFGSAAFLYAILWIVLPKARNAADRLAMRGEQINVQNIAKEVEDGFDRLASRMGDIGGEAKKKGEQFMDGARASGLGGKVATGVSTGVSGLGRLIGGGLRIVLFFVKMIVWFVLGAVLVALIGAWIALVMGIIWGKPLLGYVSPFSTGTSYLGLLMGFLVLAIPLFGLVSVFSRRYFRTQNPRWLAPTLGGAFGLSFFGLIALAGVTASKFSQTGTATKNVDLSAVRSDTLNIQALTDLGGNDINWTFGKYRNRWDHDQYEDNLVKLYDDHLSVLVPIDLRVKKTSGSQFELQQTVLAQGGRVNDAQLTATNVQFPIEVLDGKINVPNFINIPSGEKWRVQRIELTLFVPIGKYVRFGRIANNWLDGADYSPSNHNRHQFGEPDQLYKMTDRGLTCPDCPMDGEYSRDGFEDFSEINVVGNLDLKISQSEDSEVRLEDEKLYAKLVKFEQDGDRLTINSQVAEGQKPPRLVLKMNNLRQVFAENCTNLDIRDFDENEIEMTLINVKNSRADLKSNGFRVKQLGKGEFQLLGSCRELTATLSDGAVFDATNFSCDIANVKATGGSRATVDADESFEPKTDGGSEVKNLGRAQKHDRQENQ